MAKLMVLLSSPTLTAFIKGHFQKGEGDQSLGFLQYIANDSTGKVLTAICGSSLALPHLVKERFSLQLVDLNHLQAAERC